MKRNFNFFLLLLGASISGCPTCVGRVTKQTKPFFSDEFYVSHKSMDHLYQAIKEAELAHEKKSDVSSHQQVAKNRTPDELAVAKKEQ